MASHEDRIRDLEYETNRIAHRLDEAERRSNREWQGRAEAERDAKAARRDLEEEVERAKRAGGSWRSDLSALREHLIALDQVTGFWIRAGLAATSVLAVVALAEAIAIWLLWRSR